jgi:RNA polymerase sigma factor (sigma-70 family)
LIEDIRQETFLRVLQAVRRPDGIQSPDRFPAFVNAVCDRVTLELLRSGTRHPQITDDITELIDSHGDPTRNVVSQERKKIIAGVLSELTERDQEILRLLYLEEIEKDLICQRMNINSGYLRVLIHRAKAHFRSALGSAAGPGL